MVVEEILDDLNKLFIDYIVVSQYLFENSEVFVHHSYCFFSFVRVGLIVGYLTQVFLAELYNYFRFYLATNSHADDASC